MSARHDVVAAWERCKNSTGGSLDEYLPFESCPNCGDETNLLTISETGVEHCGCYYERRGRVTHLTDPWAGLVDQPGWSRERLESMPLLAWAFYQDRPRA